MIYFLIFQLSQCLLGSDDSLFLIFHSVDDIVIGHTAFNYVIQKLLRPAFATIHHVFQPFKIVAFKNFYAVVFKRNGFIVKQIRRKNRNGISSFSFRIPLLPMTQPVRAVL